MVDLNFAHDPIYRYLDTNGDGTGTKSAVGDYSGAATSFHITLPAGYERLLLSRVIINIEDGPSFDANDYGAIAGGLTNGITVNWDYHGTVFDLTDGVPVKTNAGWGKQCYDITLQDFGTGNNFLLVRWTFQKRGAPLVIEAGDMLEFVLNDDFTDLLSHYFQVQGLAY